MRGRGERGREGRKERLSCVEWEGVRRGKAKERDEGREGRERIEKSFRLWAKAASAFRSKTSILRSLVDTPSRQRQALLRASCDGRAEGEG